MLEKQHPSMVNGVEVQPDVRVERPTHFPMTRNIHRVEGVVLQSTGSETVEEADELAVNYVTPRSQKSS